MAYGVPHSLSLPVIGTDSGTVGATKVNTAFEALQATVNAKVTPAGFDMNADLSYRSGASYFGAKELQRASFRFQDIGDIDPVDFPATVFVGEDGELYFNDLDGNQVKITAAGGVTAAVGNITGTGYGAGGKEVNWDDTNLDYRMRSGSGTNDFADVVVNDIRLNDGSGNFARLGAGAMIADLTFTLPTTHPGSTSVMQMTSTGAMSADPAANITTSGQGSFGTLLASGAVTFSGGLTVDEATVTGVLGVDNLAVTDDIDVGDNLFVHGSAIIDGGVVAAQLEADTNGDVIVSGTGRYLHGNMQIVIPASAFIPIDPADQTLHEGTAALLGGPGDGVNTFGHWFCDVGAVHFWAPIILPVGAHIRGAVATFFGGGVAGTRSFQIRSTETATDTVTLEESNSTASTTGVLALDVGTCDIEMLATSDYWMKVELSGDDYLKSVLITYDFPAA